MEQNMGAIREEEEPVPETEMDRKGPKERLMKNETKMILYENR